MNIKNTIPEDSLIFCDIKWKHYFFFFLSFPSQVLQHTNKYYMSVINTTFILYAIVYMSGQHVLT